MWVNTEQTLRIKINSLYCSFLGAGGLPAGAEPLASCWDKHFVRLLVLVLWSNARLWLVTAIAAISQTHFQAFVYLVYQTVHPCFSLGV